MMNSWAAAFENPGDVISGVFASVSLKAQVAGVSFRLKEVWLCKESGVTVSRVSFYSVFYPFLLLRFSVESSEVNE